MVSAKRGNGKENKNTAIAEQALARFFFIVIWFDRLSKLEFHSRLVGKVIVFLLDDSIACPFINPPRRIGQILDVKINPDAIAEDVANRQV